MNSPHHHVKRSSKKRKNGGIFDKKIDDIAPNCEEELAVHPKKLAELKQWIRTKMSVDRGSKTLLLTGPSGSGKKSAVKLLCWEMGIEVTEWDWSDEYRLDGWGETVSRHSSLNNFVQFLQETEFCSIQRMSLKHRLLLISQLPSPLIKEPKYFHEILSDVVRRSRCIIVIVLPNTDACWELSPFRLIPPAVLDSLGIGQIKFNAVSATLMTTAVKRASEKLHLACNAQKVKDILNCSFGDIRRAMNLLLLIKQGQAKSSPSVSAKRHRIAEKPSWPSSLALQSASASSSKLQQPANRLELFHFIGKVLYAKRGERSAEWDRSESKLHPKAMQRHCRPLPPKDELNWLIDSAPISAQMLSSYVSEHQPRFAPSIGAAAAVARTMAELDVLVGSSFEHKSTLEKYQMDLTIRTSLFHNYRPSSAGKTSGHRFYQFEKPRTREMDLKRVEMAQQIAQLFPLGRCSEMATLLLPTISSSPSASVSRDQFELLEQLCLPSRRPLPLPMANIQRQQPHQTSVEPEMHAEMATLEERESPDASRGSFYSIASHYSEPGEGQMEDDGFNYDIEEVEDEE